MYIYFLGCVSPLVSRGASRPWFPGVRLAPGLQRCVSPLVSRDASRPWSPRGASRPLGCFPMFFLCFPMFSYWAGGSYPPQ